MVCWYHFHPHLTWHLEAITHDFSDNFFETLFRPDLVYLKSSDPFVSLLFISLWFAFLTGLAGWITQEFSWVDRIWSLTPPFYAWLFALHPFLALEEAWPSSIGGYIFGRPFLLAWLTTLWGVRLTYNFWRKGGYAGGGEDYRWAEVRTWFSHFTLQMFNIFFIAMFQNVLLLLLVMPAHSAWVGRTWQPLTCVDAFLVIFFLLCLAVETVADQQQWEFQQRKRAALAAAAAISPVAPIAAATATGTTTPAGSPTTPAGSPSRNNNKSPNRKNRNKNKNKNKNNHQHNNDNHNISSSTPSSPLRRLFSREIADGFCQSGLFARCRHPNFSAEIALWWVFHIFVYPSAGIHFERKHDWVNHTYWPFYINWTIIGPVLLTLLFQGSTDLTEKLSVRKYPRYRQYQQRVPRLWPLFGEVGKEALKNE